MKIGTGLAALALWFAFGVCQSLPAAEKPAIPSIPKVTVRAVLEPYYVCSAAIIGIEKGWYDEVGITFSPPPYGKVVTGAETVQMVASQTIDMIDQPTIHLLGAIRDLPKVKVFVHDSMFWGSIVVGNPKFKSAEEFMADGDTPEQALEKALAQIKGKRYGYDGTTGSLSFVNTVFRKGGFETKDVDLHAFQDPEIAAMMFTDQIDFCGGMGLPVAQELLSKGFKVIATAAQIATSAKASPDSIELRTIFPVGWTTYDSFIENNYDTILRFTSVVWRQTRFQNENQEEALAIHTPFINSISGARNTIEQVKYAYDIFDPFVRMEDQARWYNDPGYPLYEDHILGSYINSWIESGYLEKGEVKPSDITIAGKVYKDMLDLKKKAEAEAAEAKRILGEGKGGLEAVKQSAELLAKARGFLESYNYLDASRFAAAAKEWAIYSETVKD